MKLHWGHYIAIALACFMIFILSLLFFANDSGHAMVTEDYYEKELTFQNEIDAQKNANALVDKPEVNLQANGFLIKFPKEFADANGNVFLMRNNNQEQDVKMPLKIDRNGNFLIPSVKLVDGEYDLILSWKFNNKEYLIKKPIQWISQ